MISESRVDLSGLQFAATAMRYRTWVLFVGFVSKPRNQRPIFSTGACLLTLAPSAALIAQHGLIP